MRTLPDALGAVLDCPQDVPSVSVEFAVRRAIGASRGTIVRQLLVESLLLALGAAVLGLGLAGFGLHLLASQLPHGDTAGLDARVLGFTILLAVATGFGFGVMPALRASAPALEQSLRDGAGGTVGRRRRRARDVLVVSEVALALVLLVGSALLLRSFIALRAVNPGSVSRPRATPPRAGNAISTTISWSAFEPNRASARSPSPTDSRSPGSIGWG